jgi:hypothetical protein
MENVGFTFRIRQNGNVVASASGTVNAYGHWGATITTSSGTYTCGAATAEVAEDGNTKDFNEISFDDSGCG